MSEIKMDEFDKHQNMMNEIERHFVSYNDLYISAAKKLALNFNNANFDHVEVLEEAIKRYGYDGIKSIALLTNMGFKVFRNLHANKDNQIDLGTVKYEGENEKLQNRGKNLTKPKEVTKVIHISKKFENILLPFKNKLRTMDSVINDGVILTSVKHAIATYKYTEKNAPTVARIRQILPYFFMMISKDLGLHSRRQQNFSVNEILNNDAISNFQNTNTIIKLKIWKAYLIHKNWMGKVGNTKRNLPSAGIMNLKQALSSSIPPKTKSEKEVLHFVEAIFDIYELNDLVEEIEDIKSVFDEIQINGKPIKDKLTKEFIETNSGQKIINFKCGNLMPAFADLSKQIHVMIEKADFEITKDNSDLTMKYENNENTEPTDLNTSIIDTNKINKIIEEAKKKGGKNNKNNNDQKTKEDAMKNENEIIQT